MPGQTKTYNFTVNNLEQKYLSALREIFKRLFSDIPAEIILFGSRSTGKNTDLSDIDIAIKSQNDISTPISYAKELIENSNIPYHVDIVEYSTLSGTLKHNIDTDGILIWKN